MRNVDKSTSPVECTDVFREIVWVGSCVSGALIFLGFGENLRIQIPNHCVIGWVPQNYTLMPHDRGYTSCRLLKSNHPIP